MTRRAICLLSAITAMHSLTLGAQEGTTNSAEGTLMLNNKTYQLTHALAYESMIDAEDAAVVVLSAQPISSEQLKQAREAEKEGGDGEFKKPFLKLVFKKTGELKHWSAAASGTQIGRHSSSNASAQLQLPEGRAIGQANQPAESEAMFPTSFDVRFNLALLKPGESLPESTARKGGPAANVKPTVTGIFKGNGKDAKLAYVSARWSEPFSGKPGITLVFTEKDHSKEKKPEIGATFGKFGSALIISLHEDGQIYSCQVAHSAHQKQGFSSIGSIEATPFTYEDGKVEGELTTNGELDTFGEKWEVKLKFVAPLGEIPKEFQVAETKKPEKRATPAASDADEGDNDELATKLLGAKPASQSAAAGLNAKDLALTKDASEIEYKALVQQLAFKSKSDVKKVCAELAANLNAQGWTSDGPDMVNPQSSILKRKRGEASLTIFVKPANGGSEVKMMTEGLSWE